MVLRHDGPGVLAIGQPAHAWLCGQFARAWGNDRFGAVTPLDEVALAAEQHDVGMAQWDLNPTLNVGTGLPQSFTEMGIEVNAGLWRAGPARLVAQSRYAALLATMHGRRLYERRDLDPLPDAAAAAIRGLLAHSAVLEAALAAALRADPLTAPHASPEQIERNSRLLWTWDTLSLGLLLDWAPHSLAGVPTAGGGATEIELRGSGRRDGIPVASLAPWPFRDPTRVDVHCDGRRLTQRFGSDRELAEGLARAPWETVRFELVPG